jgi:hypothetical protein
VYEVPTPHIAALGHGGRGANISTGVPDADLDRLPAIPSAHTSGLPCGARQRLHPQDTAVNR